MELSLLIIFFYGMLHALGADHLSAIALFSIGKNKSETLILSFLFALGHGFVLFLFANFLKVIVSNDFLKYADLISAFVILLMGLYLLYLVISNSIVINKHFHKNKEHIHIYYNNKHKHDKGILVSLSLLMGAGGLRGMLITLSIVSNEQVNFYMIIAFILGVSIIFILFGLLIYLINTKYINNIKTLKYFIVSVASISIIIGFNNILGFNYAI